MVKKKNKHKHVGRPTIVLLMLLTFIFCAIWLALSLTILLHKSSATSSITFSVGLRNGANVAESYLLL